MGADRYLIMSALILTGLIRRPRFVLFASVFAIGLPAVLHLVLMAMAQIQMTASLAAPMLDPISYFNPPSLDRGAATISGIAKWFVLTLCGWDFRVIPFFLGGCLLYVFRYRVAYHWGAGTSFVLLMLLASFAIPAQWDGPLFNVVLCPILVYLTVLIGLTRVPALPIFRRGDYSYGIYLYGYPIQQVVVLAGLDRHIWWQNAVISIPLITLFAMFSWHTIERPNLLQRKRLSFLGRREISCQGRASGGRLEGTEARSASQP